MALFVISGVSASGKSTVARLLAEQTVDAILAQLDASRVRLPQPA